MEWKQLAQTMFGQYQAVYLLDFARNTYQLLAAAESEGDEAERSAFLEPESGEQTGADGFLERCAGQVHPDFRQRFRLLFGWKSIQACRKERERASILPCLMAGKDGAWHPVRVQALAVAGGEESQALLLFREEAEAVLPDPAAQDEGAWSPEPPYLQPHPQAAHVGAALPAVPGEDGMDRRDMQWFVDAVKNLYESIYETDLCTGSVHVWKEGDMDMPLTRNESLKQHLDIAADQFVHPDYRDRFRSVFTAEGLKAAFARGETRLDIEVPLIHHDGFRWFHIQAQLLERKEESVRVMLYLRDIEEKRREEERYQKAVVEAMQLMKAVSTTYDMLISVNLTQNTYHMVEYEKFLNHTALAEGCFDDLIAAGATTVPEPFRQQFVDQFSREALLKAYAEGRSSVYLEHQQVADDGVVHWVSTHVMFTQNPYNGDILEITASRCIDELREKEEKNRQILRDALHLAEQANDAKTSFLSRMSHDIRTPMNAIIGMTTIASANLNNQEKLRDCLGKIDASSRYLLSLINAILDLSRIESGKMTIVQEPFDLREMIGSLEGICAVQAQEKDQELTVHVSHRIQSWYVGDELRLKQILMNLLGNALKYTPPQGRIQFTVQAKNTVADVTMIEFMVRDTGIGITPEFQKKMFDAFTQDVNASGRTGSGLGLAITQNLVHLMNGDITVQSEYGKGSCFVVELPLKNAAVQPETGPEAGRPGPARDAAWKAGAARAAGAGGQYGAAGTYGPAGMSRTAGENGAAWNDESETEDGARMFAGERILLAEDNLLNQEIAVELLEMQGLKVEVAENGQLAAEMFEASEPGTYSMILMDIQMPVMNGYEATRRIRGSGHPEAKTIPIYALTANAFSGDVLEALSSGMNGHISKPVDFEEIIRILRTAI